jgi:two-component system response regulator RegA
MQRSFREFGGAHSLSVAMTFPEALDTVLARRPDFVISELRVAGRSLFDFLDLFSEASPFNRFAVATLYPSVATAVRLIRMGLAAYFIKPVSAAAILAELKSDRHGPAIEGEGSYTWPTLNRTIWEYLNQVYVSAGSMSEAARRLGLHRRSLRRMLAKYPPAR